MKMYGKEPSDLTVCKFIGLNLTDVLFFDKPERSKLIELANKQESIIKDLELWRLT